MGICMSNWKIIGIILPSRLGSMWAPGCLSEKACEAYANDVLDSDAFWEGVADANV